MPIKFPFRGLILHDAQDFSTLYEFCKEKVTPISSAGIEIKEGEIKPGDVFIVSAQQRWHDGMKWSKGHQSDTGSRAEIVRYKQQDGTLAKMTKVMGPWRIVTYSDSSAEGGGSTLVNQRGWIELQQHLSCEPSDKATIMARLHEERIDPHETLATPADFPDDLIVIHDQAELHHHKSRYTLAMSRVILNNSARPCSQCLVRIAVDKFPDNPNASKRLYREHPLNLEDLCFAATCNGEPMEWIIKCDSDSIKELWLQFRNNEMVFPLRNGEEATIRYSYMVGEDRWGDWFQRAVRLTTKRLSVRLVFDLGTVSCVWGTQSSVTATSSLESPIVHSSNESSDEYFWCTEDPPLNSRFRLEWKFTGGSQDSGTVNKLIAFGVRQRGDPILSSAAKLYTLPEEAHEAETHIAQLMDAIRVISQYHVFSKGMGIALPQIGVGKSAAVIRPPEVNSDFIVLLNPRVIEESFERDEMYEGCLSFFDVRGLVPRPSKITIHHTLLNGETAISSYSNELARLICHEVDHLNGLLYDFRMRPGVKTIGIEDYKGTSKPWDYKTDNLK